MRNYASAVVIGTVVSTRDRGDSFVLSLDAGKAAGRILAVLRGSLATVGREHVRRGFRVYVVGSIAADAAARGRFVVAARELTILGRE